MKVSVNWIQRHSDAPLNPDGISALVTRVGAQLGAVEEVISLGERYKDILIVKVISCENHPQADRLHVCKIDDGGKTENIERDENGYVQVVCGAPNVRAGMLAAWLPPGATVPSTYGTQDPFILEARPLRGVVSNGMLASPKELAIGDSHEGIMELDTHDAGPGASFVAAYGLNDHILDIENKMFTHRPDCFGQLGVAREIAGIQHIAFKSPDWYQTNPDFPDIETEELKLEVRNEIPELVPRFVAVALRDVEVKPSPAWLQVELAKVGIRPINNIVDYTNFFMLETGQPIHAYDYDKVKALCEGEGACLTIRYPKAGEQITVLGGKVITPRAEAMMVAADQQLICVGGAIGGADTEVDDHTKNIIIEAASWDMYSMRRTSMTHGIFTDAVTRFTKGQSPLQNKAIVAKIVDEIRRHAGGKVAGPLIDDSHLPTEVMKQGSLHAPVTLDAAFVNKRLGFALTAEEMAVLLRNVEFDVAVDGERLTVAAPFWRTDIAIPEDVVEEIGRLYGFDHLPLVLPGRDLTPAQKDPLLEHKARMRSILSRAGANELLTYSFVHGNLIEKAGQEAKLAFQISNALSPDLQYFRMTLIPSLLEKIHPNMKAGYDEFVLFEMGKTHNILHANDDEGGVPKEFDTLALVFAQSDKLAAGNDGAAYYNARAYLDYVAASLGLAFDYAPFAEEPDYPVAKSYDYRRSALVSVRGTDVVLGIIGEFKSAVRKALKLPAHTAGFEIGLDGLLATVRDSQRYTAMPRFPKVRQDITLRVAADTSFGDVASFLDEQIQTLATLKQAQTSLQPIDIYQGNDMATKHLTFRLTIASYERTLTDDEVVALLDTVADAAKKRFNAARV